MAALNAIDVGKLAGRALPTTGCAGCGSEFDTNRVRIPRTYPLGLLFAIAFALPLVLSITIATVWGTRDLFDIMAGTGGRNSNELYVLRTLPVVVPALLVIASLIGLEAFCRALGLHMTLCRPCGARQSRRRVLLIIVLVLSFVALAAVLYLVPTLPIADRKWGILFAPWVILAALLATETPLAGMRIRPLSDHVLRVRGAAAFADVMQKERPGLLLTEAPAGFWPARLELWTLLVPALLVLIAIFGPRLERYPLECPYGTYPLSHRSGNARIIGCRAPDGTAHGHSRGEAGAWNSNLHSPGFSGTWWFNQPHGEFAFLDLKGRVRAQGRFVFSQPRGRWQIFDEWGSVLEELEVLTRPFRTVVHRAHPHLKCSTSEIEASGSPAWGMRACPRYDQPAPFVRTENAVIVEVGMR